MIFIGYILSHTHAHTHHAVCRVTSWAHSSPCSQDQHDQSYKTQINYLLSSWIVECKAFGFFGCSQNDLSCSSFSDLSSEFRISLSLRRKSRIHIIQIKHFPSIIQSEAHSYEATECFFCVLTELFWICENSRNCCAMCHSLCLLNLYQIDCIL